MTAPRRLEGNPWRATMIADNGEAVGVIDGTFVHISFEDGHASGDAGCNRFNGPYDSSGGGDLSFGTLATTLMACLDAIMEQEQAFLTALDGVDAYSIAGDTLEMRAAGEVVLLFTAVPTSLAGTEWRLTGLNNGKEAVVSVAADTEVTATFTEDGTMAGSSGCNTYRATYSTDGNAIQVGPAMGTKKMCFGEGVMEQEARYLEVLGLVTTYRLDGDRLEMFNDEGARQLQFVRAEA